MNKVLHFHRGEEKDTPVQCYTTGHIPLQHIISRKITGNKTVHSFPTDATNNRKVVTCFRDKFVDPTHMNMDTHGKLS